jgi:hypothetical protein
MRQLEYNKEVKLLQVRPQPSGCQQQPISVTKAHVSEVRNVSAAATNNNEQLHRRNNQQPTTIPIDQEIGQLFQQPEWR